MLHVCKPVNHPVAGLIWLMALQLRTIAVSAGWNIENFHVIREHCRKKRGGKVGGHFPTLILCGCVRRDGESLPVCRRMHGLSYSRNPVGRSVLAPTFLRNAQISLLE